jgi:hypothetical protein
LESNCGIAFGVQDGAWREDVALAVWSFLEKKQLEDWNSGV